MAVSALTLAKKIKALVANHPALVERDGTTDVPASFNFNFGGELEEASKKVRETLTPLVDALKTASIDLTTSWYPAKDDVSREAQKKRAMLYSLRALYTLKSSPRGLIRNSFQNRTYTADEVNEMISNWDNINATLCDSVAVFQFKRHDLNTNNPWVYSWMLAVDGVSVSRGAKQPLHKLISSLLKLIEWPEASNSVANNTVATLAKLKGNENAHYWYLSNQDTTMMYQAFSRYAALNSCMSKDTGWYGHTGTGQHPMDCYDDSPDWSLMTISEMSPEAITEMCDLVIANPDEADTLFKFPFLTRCLVLPTSKETSKNTFTTPYVMGKFYGQDKLVNFFYDNNSNSVYELNKNSLLSGSHYIDGGRIKAIKTTKSCDAKYLLPYFDKHNRARFVVDDEGNEWWVSLGKSTTNYVEPIAKCSYEKGSPIWLSFYSPHYNGYYEFSSYTLDTFETIFGTELERFRDDYVNYTLNGNTLLLPPKLLVHCRGKYVLQGEITNLYDGEAELTENIVNNPKQYAQIAGFGLFNLKKPLHKEVYNNILENIPTGQE